MPRTFVIGDIHGDLEALDIVLGRLPELTAEDTLIFLGDYLDRGPDSKGVIERVRSIEKQTPAKFVALRGNHEDMWVKCFQGGDEALGFLIPPGNGCVQTYHSFTGKTKTSEDGAITPLDMVDFLEVSTWFPKDVYEWMSSLPLWYEDEHAIYVHAGLEGEGTEWFHPSQCKPMPLMWMREEDFFTGYRGKRLLFGHTKVKDLPPPDLSFWRRLFDDPNDVWVNHDLIGLDTGSGKGGFLSAIELPRLKVYESR